MGTYETAQRHLSKEREEAGAIIERVEQAVHVGVCVKVVVGHLPFLRDVSRAGVREPVHVDTFGA